MYQDFKAHVDQESYVILGNDAILKCEIPSFVADMVKVTAWVDNQGNEFVLGESQGDWSTVRSFARSLVLSLAFKVPTKYQAPFPSDSPTVILCFSVVTQDYSIYISPAHVIRGNDVLLKCDIPSFVSDFVQVSNWVDNGGSVIDVADSRGKNENSRL